MCGELACAPKESTQKSLRFRLGWKDDVAGVGCDAYLGRAAVVEDDLGGWGLDEDAVADVREAGNADAGGGGEGAGVDGERDFDGGGSGVVDGDGDEPAAVVTLAGGKLARLDGDDGEVGEATVAEDPVREEPAEIFATGLFEELFEGDGLNGGVIAGDGLDAPVGEGLLEGEIAGDAAKHPPDGGGLAAVVELVGGEDEGLADRGGGGVGCLFGIEAGFGDVEWLDEVVELQESGGAALFLLGPE